MKKFVLLSLAATMFGGVAMADIYRESVNTCDATEMRAALDRATHENRAVITIVECDNGIVRTTTTSNFQPRMAMPQKCNNCGCTDCARSTSTAARAATGPTGAL